ncbi:MAG: PmoA family protein [Pirellulaceae bacterium]|nr:PmoA family protein [Pirellulaceae bacterium]
MLHATRLSLLLLCAATAAVACSDSMAAEPAANRIAVDIDEDAGALTLTVDARTAFVYRFGPDVDLPHFDPFNSPSGRPMTVKIADPYPHHRSFWVADERVQLEGQSDKANIYSSLYSGVVDKERSKWPVPPYTRRVAHVEFSNVKISGDAAEFDEKLTWKNGDVQLLDELRHYRVRALGEGEYFLDFSFQLCASYGAVTITRDASHYGIPYIRMNETFNVEKGGGKIVNSSGGVNQAGTNNQPATWVDYSAPLEGQQGWEGLACMIHPDRKPPHLWLTRDYGTWGPRGPEGFHNTTFTIPKGESYDQQVGLLIHNGDVESGNVANRYKAYGDGRL